MNNKKTVQGFIRPSFKIKIITFILFILTGLAAYKMIYYISFYELPEPTKFTKDSKEDDYCYVEIQCLTDWVYKESSDDIETTYYCGSDVDGNMFTLIIKDKDYQKFKDIVDFTYSTDENKLPPPVKITGMVKELKSSAAQVISESWEYDTVQEYYDYFGKNLINTSTNPATSKTGFSTTLFIILLIFLILNIITIIKYQARFKKSLRYTNNSEEYQNASYELEYSDNYLFNSHGIIFTNNFVFVKGKGIAVKYDSILWCYKRIHYYNGIKTGTSLMLNILLQGKFIPLNLGFKKKYDHNIEEAMAIIIQKNHNVLCGFSKENSKQYKYLKKELKNKY